LEKSQMFTLFIELLSIRIDSNISTSINPIPGAAAVAVNGNDANSVIL